MTFSIRPAQLTDLPQLLLLAQEARALLKDRRINQWQDGYPSETVLRADIRCQTGYALADGPKVLGYFALTFGTEETYARIENGRWTTPEPYGVLHRIMVSQKLRGQHAAQDIFDFWLQQTKSKNFTALRADTHPDNRPMQHLFLKNGFTPCGTIFVRNGQVRTAFEKNIP
ncbi:GNAT family N-acetyltransferase [Candidatus Avelusimicrobium stercoris]|uniref:GNAT family N-acetyltransferase n=1 Tax=Candidatus Avelusimicrobium stercoris TaxID=1947924 RepID=UPI003D0DFA2E